MGETISQAVSGIIALLIVILASYIWRLPLSKSPQAVFVVYIISAVLMFLGAYLIFRKAVQHDYAQNQRLTLIPTFLQFVIWGVFFAFPCIYNPYNWAWSQSYKEQATPIIAITGWLCVGGGLLSMLGSIAWLGLPRSIGQQGSMLETSGPYHVSRNPQMMGGVLIIIGYVVLWPSWYALGWVALFVYMAHSMIITEEEHLLQIHGENYKNYCQQVPRYLGFRRKS